MAKAEDLRSTEAKLAALQRLREEALHSGDERAVERQRERGKLLARERLEKLPRPGQLRRARPLRAPPQPALRDDGQHGDAVVTGYGTIFGRKVFVFSQDFTVFGGIALSEAFAEKICKVIDLALKLGCPLIGINDSGGARIQRASSPSAATRRSSGATSRPPASSRRSAWSWARAPAGLFYCRR